MNTKMMKIIGIATAVVGVGVTLTNEWIGNKQMEIKIAEEVSKAVENALKNK
jgi:hypothetical protein